MTISVETVLGPVPGDQLGVILPHEHVFTDVVKEMRGAGFMADEELAVDELEPLVSAGCNTIVELTNLGIGRRPAMLASVSKRTGLNIVMGCGLYREPYLDVLDLDRLEASGLADMMMEEIESGIGPERIRPGVIGEIGAEGPHITCAEERVFRAAARASAQSGLSIVTHAARHELGLRQLDILESEGVNPNSVTIGHCGTVPNSSYHRAVAERGAFVAFDAIRGTNERDTTQNLRYIADLLDLGFGKQILISQDVCFKPHLKAYGGRGYDYLLTEFVPRLRAEIGLSEEDISQLVKVNPARSLGVGRE